MLAAWPSSKKPAVRLRNPVRTTSLADGLIDFLAGPVYSVAPSRQFPEMIAFRVAPALNSVKKSDLSAIASVAMAPIGAPNTRLNRGAVNSAAAMPAASSGMNWKTQQAA